MSYPESDPLRLRPLQGRKWLLGWARAGSGRRRKTADRPGGRSTREWLLGAFLILSVLAALGYGFFSWSRMAQQLDVQGRTRAQLLMSEFQRAYREQAKTPQDTLRGIRNQLLADRMALGDVLYAQIVENQKLMGERVRVEGLVIGLVRPMPGAQQVREVRDRSGLHYLDVVQGFPGEPGTYLRIGYSLAASDQALAEQRQLLTLLGAAFILLSAGLALLLHRRLIGPLTLLAGQVRRFGQGQIPELPEGRPLPGEVGLLAREFRVMSRTIRARNEELQRVNRELAQASQVKSEFLAMSGHELKTPLHSILGHTQLLLEGVDGPITPDQGRDLTEIRRSGQHLLELIENILHFSKNGTSEQMEPVRLELGPLVARCAETMNPDVRRKQLNLHLDLAPEVHVVADETKLRQVVLNLLSNAVKFTPEGGDIWVRVRPLEDRVRVEVDDSGPGVRPEEMSRIFEPFQQGTAARREATAGLGLGLAVARRYVEMHQGEMGVERLPSGSRFHFTLPTQSFRR
ncbi:sensor histidine kinase [Limnochorda pilosa]|uniref:histidine kinase n=1 Tax=Limnochorda pilosa TaxID=1555112 RepID=A0A0K2SNQ4_LIMPI|nr:HAMP domain-containing sensor histidine kinase [Limnochorda pilosa]BAS28763.1 signal transduction histidine kinase [Limnochorda pilosa]